MAPLKIIDIDSLEKTLSFLKTGIQKSGFVSTDYLPKFEYYNAGTIDEAIFLLKAKEGKAAIIAGGTSLLRELKRRVQPAQPKCLINIKTIGFYDLKKFMTNRDNAIIYFRYMFWKISQIR